jgi:hypothetical protein
MEVNFFINRVVVSCILLARSAHAAKLRYYIFILLGKAAPGDTTGKKRITSRCERKIEYSLG